MLDSAIKLRDALSETGQKIVFAESCTAGRIAATLGVLPGISEWLCGSFVIYRNASKANWLGIPTAILDDPHLGPVSVEVTSLLAEEALKRTPEADLAVAITGEIGPGAANGKDGIVFCASRFRRGSLTDCRQYRLHSPSPVTPVDFQSRLQRLEEATEWALQMARSAIESNR